MHRVGVGLACVLLLASLSAAEESEPLRQTRYPIVVTSGAVIQVEVEQTGADVLLRFFDPAGVQRMEVDRWTRDAGPELILWLAEVGGEYVVQVEAPSDDGWSSPEINVLDPATSNLRQVALAYSEFPALAQAQAWQELEALAQRFEALGAHALALEARFEVALGGGGLGGWQMAADAFAQLAERARGLDEAMWEVLVRDGLVQALIDAQQTPQAIVESQRVLELCRRLESEGQPMTFWRGLTWMRLQRAYGFLGDVEASMDAAQRALDFLPSPRDDSRRFEVLHQRGVLRRRSLGDPEGALQDFQLALDLQGNDARWRRDRITTLQQMGQAYEELGDVAAARGAYEAGLRDLGDDDPCEISNHRSRLALLLDGKARRLRAVAWETARREGSAADRTALQQAQELDELSGTHRRPAAELLESQAQAGNDCGRDGSASRSRLAELERRRGQLDAAAALHHQRLAAAEATDDDLATLESRIALARILRAGDLEGDVGEGDLEDALQHLAMAMDLYETLRSDVERQDLRLGLANATRHLFDLRIAVLTQDGSSGESPLTLRPLDGPQAKALAVAEQGRARLFFDAWNRTQRQTSNSEPRHDPASRIDDESVAALAHRLGSADHLLEVRLGPEVSHLWWLSEAGLRYRALPPQTQLEAAAQAARQALQRPTSSYEAPLRRLTHLLLGPWQEELDAVARSSKDPPRLWIVADGVLETLPFAALSLEMSDYRPLMEAWQVVHLPTANLLLHRAAPHPRNVRSMVVFADPETRHGAPLVGAGEEGERLRHWAVDQDLKVKLWTKRQATKSRLLSGDLASADLLHFAVHGRAHPTSPADAALLLADIDEAGNAVDGRLRARDLQGLQLAAQLVVLSGCDTGLGPVEPGEGMISGLSRGFLMAGAEQVMSSLWQVSDAATSSLMTNFYRELVPVSGSRAQGLQPAAALRLAQQDLRRESSTAHPFYWAGFVVQGSDLESEVLNE